MVGLPDDKTNFEDMCNRLDTIPPLPACDRQTDRQTLSCHGIVRAMHMRRAVKMCAKITICDGRELPWVDEIRYLGVLIVCGAKLKCSTDQVVYVNG